MYRGSRPRILPIIIVIIIVALVVATLVTVGRMLFSGDNTTTQSNKKESDSSLFQKAIVSQDTNRSVQWTVRGPIVSNEKFRSYQITISPSSRTYVTYSGYLDQVTDTKSYDNNAKAYEQFVYALDKTDLTKTRSVPDADLRGVCATQGLAYQFETLVDGTADHTEWSSTCKDSQGTMTANALQVQALFVNQIPDFHPLFNQVY